MERSFSSHKSSGGENNERLWAIGALTLTIPALVWIYNKHQAYSHHKEKHSAVLINDLKELQEEFGQRSTEVVDSSVKLPDAKGIIVAKYVLVGGGSATFAASEEIKRLEPNADVLIISDESYPPYMRPPLSKELWFNSEIAMTNALRFTDWHGEEKPIFYQDEGYFETKDIAYTGTKPRLIMNKIAVKLDVEAKMLILDDGQAVNYDKLLIATGGRPKQLPLLKETSNEVLRHCSTFRGVGDLYHLLDIVKRSERIAIVGGGFLGSELAVALAQHSRTHLGNKLQITQLFPEDGNMALVFPRYLSKWTMSRIKKAGVDVLSNTTIKNMSQTTGKNHSLLLQLSNDTNLEVDHLVVAIGIEPNIELAKSAGFEIDSDRGGIVTNSQLQVCKDVYAAGDVISFHDPSLGIRRRVEHYDHAILSGRTAAANLVNADSKKYSVQSMFWSDLGPEIGYEAVGLVDSKLTTVGVWAEAAEMDSPKAAPLEPSDIRAQSIGNVSSRTSEPSQTIDKLKSVIPSPVGEKSYGKGVVFYIQDRRIVGLLMFNLFNRLDLARDIINKRTSVEDLENLVDLFNINAESPGQ